VRQTPHAEQVPDRDLILVLNNDGRPVLHLYTGGHMSIPACVTLKEAAEKWMALFRRRVPCA